jgi:hypothetical protein
MVIVVTMIISVTMVSLVISATMVALVDMVTELTQGDRQPWVPYMCSFHALRAKNAY